MGRFKGCGYVSWNGDRCGERTGGRILVCQRCLHGLGGQPRWGLILFFALLGLVGPPLVTWWYGIGWFQP